jgi:DNA replication protein DnaC
MERINNKKYVEFLNNHSKVSRDSPIVAILGSGTLFVKDDNEFIIVSPYGFKRDKLKENLESLSILTNEFLGTTDIELVIAQDYEEIWQQVATTEERKEREEKQEQERLEKEKQEKQEEEDRKEQIRQGIIDAFKLFLKNTSIDADKYGLSNMVKNDGNSKAINAVKEWVKEPEYNRENTHHFLTLVGECGRGKTHLALCIANEYLKRPNELSYWSRACKVDYFQVASLLTQIKAGYNNNSNDAVMDRCNKSDLLILDDLGMQRDTDWALEQLDMIIDNRYIKKQDTVFTTNMKLSDLPKRIASRLAEGDSYVIGGDDYRMIKAKERKKK